MKVMDAWKKYDPDDLDALPCPPTDAPIFSLSRFHPILAPDWLRTG